MFSIYGDHAIVKHTCPICGKVCEIELDREQAIDYFCNNKLIQDALSELTAAEREFVKSGYCPDCQELLFGNADTDKIKITSY